ncbi:MAG: lipoprotein [Xanthobacteraceae bacterium]|nr:lipoprotein [Xanthobacteraceae bacterium]
MKRTSGLKSKFLALAVLAATVALGGCGRKAGLDLPPDAAAAPTAQATSSTTPTDPNAKSGASAAQGNLFNTANPSDRTSYAPKLPPKRIAIDPILD